MQTSKINLVIQIFFCVGMISVAASIAYLSYSLITVNKQLPKVLKQIEVSTQKIIDIVKVVDAINRQIPEVLVEIREVRQQIPPVLKEVAALQKQFPLVLEESAKIRRHIPTIMDEMGAYRKAMPTMLAEVAAVREVIPSTLDRMALLINELDEISKNIGENAFQNVFAGIIKAPFKFVQSFGAELFKEREVSFSDRQLIADKSLILLNSGKIDQSVLIKSKISKLNGNVKLIAEKVIDGQYCRGLEVTVTNFPVSEHTVCKDEDDEWQLINIRD